MKLVLLLVLGVTSISADSKQIDNEIFSKVINYAETTRILNQFIAGNSLFARDVYKELMKSNVDQSFVVSPLLAELTLATIHHGAGGKTALELSSRLHLPNSKNDIKKAVETLNSYLKNVLSRFNYKIEVDDKYKIPDEFKSTADAFKSIVHVNNFANKNAAIAEMNKWAEERTYNKIKDLIHEDDLDENTCALLLNAIYFNDVWEQAFPTEGTKHFPFYPDKETEINITTMEQFANLSYYNSVELDAEFLELPYHQANNITLTIVVPNQMGTLDFLEDHLSEVLAEHKYKKRLVELKLPKFDIQSRIDFNPILKALGIVEAFSNKADFKDIVEKFKINKFIQKAGIKVEEEGDIESLLPLRSAVVHHPVTGPTSETVHADHPFIFFVKIKNVVLLVGRYTGPSKV